MAASNAAEMQQLSMDIGEANAHQKFLDVAYRAGLYLANKGEPFTSGDLRDAITEHYPEAGTHDDRTLGSVMRRLSRVGAIVPTGRYVKSERLRNHNRPMREWVGVEENF